MSRKRGDVDDAIGSAANIGISADRGHAASSASVRPATLARFQTASARIPRLYASPRPARQERPPAPDRKSGGSTPITVKGVRNAIAGAAASPPVRPWLTAVEIRRARRRRDASRFKPTGELPARDDDRVGERTGQAVERAGAAAPVLEVRPRYPGSALFRDEHQPIGVRIRQRPHQHGVPDREDGRCRADAQDEQRERGDREPWRASKDRCRVSDLAPGGVEPDCANVADRFCRVRQSTDVPERQPARLVGRYPARAMALHLTLDVVLKLLAHFAVDPAAPGESDRGTRSNG